MMNCNLSPGKSNKLSLRLMQHAPLQSNSTPHSFHQSLTVKRIQAEFGQCNIIRKTGKNPKTNVIHPINTPYIGLQKHYMYIWDSVVLSTHKLDYTLP